MAFAQFFNTRAEFRVLDRSEVAYGWVSKDSVGILVLEVDDPPEISYGQEVRITLSTSNMRTTIQTHFIGCENGYFLFSMPSTFAREVGTTNARVRQRLLAAQITHGGKKHPVIVTDVSRGGIGIDSPVELPAGANVNVEVAYEEQSLKFEIQIRHCRNKDDGGFHTGGIITDISRIDVLKWFKIIDGELTNKPSVQFASTLNLPNQNF